MFDTKVPARILRMFFHDCFIRGCDASVLLDSTPQNQAEKDGPPNISLRAFYVIDDAKTKLESPCPATVSCADIITIAARDVVAMSGGPYWNVLKGRKDGRVSKASVTVNLPAPTFNVSTLFQSFAKRARLRNFSSVHPVFARTLRKQCPKPNTDRNAGQFLESTASTFDNNYYKQVVAMKGVFGSDQALFSDYRTRWIVESFANDQNLFFREFAASMVKL
ncbi:Peroxidase 66 [Hibiscus syriacus]|uniref:peroxidase n=1 Tax=Hibiscus syriacus TaxID=106335 RepID=A0A6A3DB38_HIBSY|nr:Peroxidase 66 [Hibiscus syriacus]